MNHDSEKVSFESLLKQGRLCFPLPITSCDSIPASYFGGRHIGYCPYSVWTDSYHTNPILLLDNENVGFSRWNFVSISQLKLGHR